MTLQEILAALAAKTEIKQGVIDALKAEGELYTKAQIEAANKDLEANKNVILSEKREIKSKYDELAAKYTALETAHKEAAEKSGKDGKSSPELEVLSAEIKNVKAALEKMTTERDGLISRINSGVVEGEISKHLDKLNVSAPYKNLLTEHFKGQAALKTFTDQAGQEQKAIMFGDKMADSFFTEWGKSADAKAFITADKNSGGGSGGGSGTGGEKNTYADAFKQALSTK